MRMPKRPLLSLLAAALVAAPGVCSAATADAVEVGKPLPPWQAGSLDIHHINTGRGEAQLIVLPDGTSVLVDASGKTVEKAPFSLPTRPDASRPPGEWVARYAQRVLPQPERGIDYAVISHFHGDHMGVIVADSPRSRQGDYQLSGITEVAEHLRIGTVIDRDWPDYRWPARIENATMRNYRRFLDWQRTHRQLRVERFEPGRGDQIVPLHDARRWPQVQVRNLAANGQVWTGLGDGRRQWVPPLASLAPEQYPVENKLSIAFRLSYGRFDYYTGGDLSAGEKETEASPEAWQDVERLVGLACGPVEAMKANHHGSWDANSLPFLAALRPRVIVVGSRAEGHPSVNTWKRMTSQGAWPGERDIFVTNVSAATAMTTFGIDQARGAQGHVVIRVAPGGDSYRVLMLDDRDERMTVTSISGPYRAQ